MSTSSPNPSPRRLAGVALLAALAALVFPCATARAQAAVNEIVRVDPFSAAAGTTGLLVTFTLDTDSPPAPPANVPPTSATIGSLAGAAPAHASQYVVTATFAIPAGEAPGPQDCVVLFTTPTGGTLTFSLAGGFTVTAATGEPRITRQPASVASCAGRDVAFSVEATGDAPLAFQWQKDLADVPGATSASLVLRAVTTADAGSYRCVVTNGSGSDVSQAAALTVDPGPCTGRFPVVDTAQADCYDDTAAIACPAAGAAFFGQDAQHAGHAPSYATSPDGLTVLDGVTGLTWQQSPDTNLDGRLDSTDKMTWAAALAHPATLNARRFGGHGDWRLPTIKELYSLMSFAGLDPSGYAGTDTSWLTPFVDTRYFGFVYGDTSAGERLIDAQYWSSTPYVSTTMGGDATAFGVNFADGRIKGYPTETGPGGRPMTGFVRCVRGNPLYGVNDFADEGDGTVTDRATGLQWTRADSGTGMDWAAALAWAQAMNAARHLGHDDWRLPDIKELQGLLDYTRSPDTTASAALDPIFEVTEILNEAGEPDYPFYWSSTTHAGASGPGAVSGAWAAYACFGRATGYMTAWIDVHGAGAQRSDPKAGDPAAYPTGHGPQGDSVRILNHVRLVRDATAPPGHAVLRRPLADPATWTTVLPLDPVRDLHATVTAGPLVLPSEAGTSALAFYDVPDAALLRVTRTAADVELDFSF